jgi:hypothetical protein
MKSTLLRGTNKRMVIVKSNDSKLFEEAHFILREDPTELSLPDLLEEANRIVEKSRFPGSAKKGKRRNWQFVAGIFTGAAIEALGLVLYLLIH